MQTNRWGGAVKRISMGQSNVKASMYKNKCFQTGSFLEELLDFFCFPSFGTVELLRPELMNEMAGTKNGSTGGNSRVHSLIWLICTDERQIKVQ